MHVAGDVVTEFNEKPTVPEGFVSGGFFVFQREFFDYLNDDPQLFFEHEPLRNLARDGELAVFPHEDFWMGMDTYREFTELNDIWADGTAAWKVWATDRRRSVTPPRQLPRPTRGAAERRRTVRFTETPIADARLVDLERLEDERGFFARAYCAEEFAAHGLQPVIAQANMSFNRTRGTLRGMHYQVDPAVETKLVRCTRGAIWDVIIDMRPDSPTYLLHFGVELSARIAAPSTCRRCVRTASRPWSTTPR